MDAPPPNSCRLRLVAGVVPVSMLIDAAEQSVGRGGLFRPASRGSRLCRLTLQQAHLASYTKPLEPTLR